MKHIDNGRLAYQPSDLIELFIYGDPNRIRSSRALEKECKLVSGRDQLVLVSFLGRDRNYS
jgi:hypothetical protein